MTINTINFLKNPGYHASALLIMTKKLGVFGKIVTAIKTNTDIGVIASRMS